MVWDRTVTACLCAMPEKKVSQMAKEKENSFLRIRFLCAQFLRGYTDIPARCVHLFTEETNSDVVKKIYFENNAFYLVSLIEHKLDVDYNVAYEKTRSRFS